MHAAVGMLRIEMSDKIDMSPLVPLRDLDNSLNPDTFVETVVNTRGKLEGLFDDLALKMNLTAQRLGTGTLLLDGPGVFIHAEGKLKSDYCSCCFSIWAASPSRAEVMYTGDKRAFESDEIFVSFITGSHDAFVVEDADHLLTARSSGNQDLHRFLAIADGVVSAQGRKILFTTNLPNVHDIDEALLRPGRCFASLNTRPLTREEGTRLIRRLCEGDAAREHAAFAKNYPGATKTCSVAAIYRACGGITP